MKSLNDSSTRIELLKMLISVGPQAIEEELPWRNWSSLIVYSSLWKRPKHASVLGRIELKNDENITHFWTHYKYLNLKPLYTMT